MIVFLSLVVLILSVIAHEVAHGYAANSLGDPTARLAGRLTLNPLPHIDPMGSVIIPALLTFTGSPIMFGWAKPVPYNPYNLKNQRWGETLVAVAGSATNLPLSIIFGLIVRFGPILGFDANMLYLAATIAFINLFWVSLISFHSLHLMASRCFTILPWHLASGLVRLEQQIHGAGMLSLILFLLFFSYIFKLVVWLFGLLTGGAYRDLWTSIKYQSSF